MAKDQKIAVRQSVAHSFLERIRFSGIFAIWIIATLLFAIAYFFMTQPANDAGDGWEVDKVPAMIDALVTSASSITQFSGGAYDNPSHNVKIVMVIQSMLGILIMGLMFAKLVAYKQETILDEIKEINQEETFTSFRRGLSLVRADILVVFDKLEAGTLKQREVHDLWIIFSGLDQTLTNIKGFFIPEKKDAPKNIPAGKFELILSSIKLTMTKVLELVKALNQNNIEWKEEMLLTSMHYDVQIVRDIAEYELARTTDRKITEKINATKAILDELEAELRQEHLAAPAPTPPMEEEVPAPQYEHLDHHGSNKDFEMMKKAENAHEPSNEETPAAPQPESQQASETADQAEVQTSIEMHTHESHHDPRIHHHEKKDQEFL